MKKTHLAMLAAAAMLPWTSGCVTAQSRMICFSPVDSQRFESVDQLLSEFNGELPFAVDESRFTCSRQDGTVIAWVAMDDANRGNQLVAALKRSTRFRTLGVGKVAAEDIELFALGPQSYRF